MNHTITEMLFLWPFTQQTFLSIVDKFYPSGKTSVVRARRTGDIEHVFPDAKVKAGGSADYRYRARIGREPMALAMSDTVHAIDWPNFKNNVTEQYQHDACRECWQAMFAFQ